MPLPTRTDVHVDRPLTNISIAFVQQDTNFVTPTVAPVVPVPNPTGKYFVMDQGRWNLDDAKLRAPATESDGTGYDVDSTPTFDCKVYAVHHDIPDQVRDNADTPLDLEDAATKLVTQKLLIRRDRLFAASYMTGGVWTRDFDGVAAAPGANQVLRWSVSGSTPIEDVWAAKDDVLKQTGMEPNVLVLGSMTVLRHLINHSSIIDRVKYGQTPNAPAMIDLTELAALFKVDRVVVMRAAYNTAQENATKSMSYIGGNTALLAYVAPSPSLMTPSAMYTFSWTRHIPGSMGFRISRFYMDQLRAMRVEGELAVDCKLISADCGAFWDSIVA